MVATAQRNGKCEILTGCVARLDFGDPLGYVDGPNLYQLELGNPITLVDPTGTKAWDIDPNAKLDLGTIANLRELFTKNVEDYVKKPTKDMDCADLALTSLAKAAQALKLPLRLPVWDAKTKKWDYLDSRADKYKSADSYITWGLAPRPRLKSRSLMIRCGGSYTNLAITRLRFRQISRLTALKTRQNPTDPIFILLDCRG
ncbi:MAG TPA: hypothetical protein VFC78_19520 [Tepidisphaeraceae bacterium]|nr:hypothetical protein [Tepidisphaeraceae bacterium]